MPLPRRPTDAELLAEVRAWIELLSEGRFVDALQLIPGEEDEGWTHQLLEDVIAGYGLPSVHPSGRKFQATSPNKAMGSIPVASVEREVLPPGALAYIEHSLPLDGKWSDLTATFVLYPSESEAILRLREVHVL